MSHQRPSAASTGDAMNTGPRPGADNAASADASAAVEPPAAVSNRTIQLPPAPAAAGAHSVFEADLSAALHQNSGPPISSAFQCRISGEVGELQSLSQKTPAAAAAEGTDRREQQQQPAQQQEQLQQDQSNQPAAASMPPLPSTSAAEDEEAGSTNLVPDFFSQHQAWCEQQLAAFRRLPLEEKWTMTILDLLMDPVWFGSFGAVHAHMALGLCTPPVPPLFPAIIIESAVFRYYLLCFCSSLSGLIAGEGASEDPSRRALFTVNQSFVGRKGNLALQCASSTMERTRVFAVAQQGESAACVVVYNAAVGSWWTVAGRHLLSKIILGHATLWTHCCCCVHD